MKTTLSAVVLAVAVAAFGAGCTLPTIDAPGPGQSDTAKGGNGNGLLSGGGGTAGQGGQAGQGAGSNGGAANPAMQGNGQYVPEQDQAKQQEIVTRMWSTLTAQRCWYMQGSNVNYSFSGNADYRYAGVADTTAGQIRLLSVGNYDGYDMAEIEISGTQYWLGIANAQTMAMSSIFDGKLITNWYGAAAPGQACI